MDMGEIGNDLFGHPIAEVFLVFLGAEVGEGKHHDGFFGDSRGRSKGFGGSLDAFNGR
ncbi:MAG: hypothetical protein NT006_11245 [Candidatus Aminicenantes bacterium]|nr:hypothetical protein [Candidatus Aminicenantes bacterium]